jgi:teichuronic acid biosynthesis glycosyltransferase TuaG
MDIPTISVITATYNRGEKFLRKCIESVQAQDFKDYEHIIVDDCSTDNTEEIVKELSKDDPRIVYIKHDKNHGTGTAGKNTGLKHARGEWICYLDDDVTYYPYHLSTFARSIKKFPKEDFFYSDMMLTDAQDNMQPGIALEFDAQFLLRRNFIDTSVACHRKELAFNVGGWDETCKRFTDWNLWIRMMKWGAKFQRIPIITILYFIHEDT